MPRFDGTGPMGAGARTGRGFGPCFGFGPAHLHHHGRGLGRYFHWGWPQSKEEQKKVLADYRRALEEELEDVRKEEEDLSKEG